MAPRRIRQAIRKRSYNSTRKTHDQNLNGERLLIRVSSASTSNGGAGLPENSEGPDKPSSLPQNGLDAEKVEMGSEIRFANAHRVQRSDQQTRPPALQPQNGFYTSMLEASNSIYHGHEADQEPEQPPQSFHALQNGFDVGIMTTSSEDNSNVQQSEGRSERWSLRQTESGGQVVDANSEIWRAWRSASKNKESSSLIEERAPPWPENGFCAGSSGRSSEIDSNGQELQQTDHEQFPPALSPAGRWSDVLKSQEIDNASPVHLQPARPLPFSNALQNDFDAGMRMTSSEDISNVQQSEGPSKLWSLPQTDSGGQMVDANSEVAIAWRSALKSKESSSLIERRAPPWPENGSRAGSLGRSSEIGSNRQKLQQTEQRLPPLSQDGIDMVGRRLEVGMSGNEVQQVFEQSAAHLPQNRCDADMLVTSLEIANVDVLPLQSEQPETKYIRPTKSFWC